MPTLPRLLTPIAVGALLIAVTASLNGCASLSDTLLHRHEERFADYSQAEKGWVGVAMPAWIPSDATDLRSVASGDESLSVVRVSTETALPDSCTDAQRRSVPFAKRSWIPRSASTSDDLADCGRYQVVKIDGGWIGWFQAREHGERPDAPLTTAD